MKLIPKLFVTLLITSVTGISCAYARGAYVPARQGVDPNSSSMQSEEERGMTSEERNALQNEQEKRTDPEATSSSY